MDQPVKFALMIKKSVKAMILAAGEGSRLRPLTLDTPKPLVSANGKPLIVYHIERLVKAGVKDIIINHARLGKTIEDFLGDGHQWGVNITYSVEKTALGTGGGVKRALSLLGNDPFILISADITTNYPFARLINRQFDEKTLGHVVLIDNPYHNTSGDFTLQDARVGMKHSGIPSLTFGSLALLKPELFNSSMTDTFSIIEPFYRAIKSDKLTGEHFAGYHCNVDTLERLQKVEHDRCAGRIKELEN